MIDKLNTNSDDESDIEEIWIICTIAILDKKRPGNFEKINGKFSTSILWNIRIFNNNDIQIFELKIFEYSY